MENDNRGGPGGTMEHEAVPQEIIVIFYGAPLGWPYNPLTLYHNFFVIHAAICQEIGGKGLRQRVCAGTMLSPLPSCAEEASVFILPPHSTGRGAGHQLCSAWESLLSQPEKGIQRETQIYIQPVGLLNLM